MKIEKRILSTERLRRCPEQFSFVDHRLVRAGYLRRAEAKAWALYLVLVTVGDEHGLSYYSDPSLARLLSLSLEEIAAARRRCGRPRGLCQSRGRRSGTQPRRAS